MAKLKGFELKKKLKGEKEISFSGPRLFRIRNNTNDAVALVNFPKAYKNFILPNPFVFSLVSVMLLGLFFSFALPKLYLNNLRVEGSKSVFTLSDSPEFKLVDNNYPFFLSPIAKKFSTVKVTAVKLITPANEELKGDFFQKEKSVFLKIPSSLQPGKYQAEIFLKYGNEEVVKKQSFLWGVVAVNVRSAVAEPAVPRDILMAVLDDYGFTICHAEVEVIITDPEGQEEFFSTNDGQIKTNPNCRDKSVTNDPDYSFTYVPELIGEYEVTVTARTLEGERTVRDSFFTEENPIINLERTAFPTRIYPVAEYPVVFSLKPQKDFLGTIIENVPSDFVIKDISNDGVVKEENSQTIVWEVSLKKDQTYEFKYTFDAPDISPWLYQLGPLTIEGSSTLQFNSGSPQVNREATGSGWREARQWQIASDAVTYTQTNFRYYVDNDEIQPADPWPAGATDLAENAAITTSDSPPDDNDLIRIRMSVTVATENLAINSQAFKLQYGEGATCGDIVTWNDVGAAGSATIWRGESDTNPADGSTISSGLLTGTNALESYEEQNNSVNNPTGIDIGQIGEWDWLVQNNGAVHDTSYCFRMVKSDGTALDTYTNYPKISTEVTTFSSSFENGNGQNFTKPYSSDATKVSFNSELDGGAAGSSLCTGWRRQNWFYFSMNNALNQSISLTLINALASSNENSNWTDHKPVYSYDGVTWYRISSTGTIASPNITYSFPGGGAKFTSDTVYIAHGIPYTYTDSENDIATWSASQYVTVEDIGYAAEGTRMMHLLTVQDTSSPVAAADKQVYWLTSRAHPMEPMASWRLKGVMDFIIGDSDEAKLMRRSSILKVIPMLNPDGVYNGNTTANMRWCNLNREWISNGPNITTEETEVYNAHLAINNWMTGGTPADVNVFMDFHTQCADPTILHAGGNGGTPGYTWYDTQNHENVFEILLKVLDGNDHDDEFWGSTSLGLTYNLFTQYHTATWGNDLESFNLEGTTYDFVDHTYPTKVNSAAFGVAYLKMAFANQENDAKVFALTQTDPLGTSTPPNYTLVVSPAKFIAVLNNDKGGGIEYWYDLENDSLLLNNLVDADSVLDPIDWNDGSQARSLINTSNATLTVNNNSGTRVKLTYTGQLENVTGLDYVLQRIIWEDGRIFTNFTLTNNTGSTVDWGEMKHSVNVDYAEAANFTASRDNSDDTPTPGTDNWWGMIGSAGGIKATFLSHYLGQTGGWVYDTYGTADDATYGKSNWYSDTDGPLLEDGSSITVNLAYQVRPDNDLLGNETQIDAWRDDLANPDTPTMANGSFTEFNKDEGGLEFAAASNRVKFTYTNATTYTKKEPAFAITGYTASTAPVLKVNNAFLDGEDGVAHSTNTHISTSYTSYVDTTSDIAYVQYLNDISTNVNVEIRDSYPHFNIGGTIYLTNETTQATSDNGGPCDSLASVVSLRVDGGDEVVAVCSSADASYSFTDVYADAGQTITVYLTSSDKANTVYVSDGTVDSGINLFIDTLVVRDEQDGTITIEDLVDYDDSDNATDMLFDADASGEPASCTVNSGIELHVWNGDSFNPNGTVTTQGAAGDLHIDDNAVAQIDDQSSAISGDVLVDDGATFTVEENVSISGGDITTSGTDATVNYSNYPTLTLSGDGTIGGGTTPSISFHNLTLTGTTALTGITYTIGGNLDLASATLTAGESTIKMTGTANGIIGGGESIYNLTIDPATAGTITLETSDLTVTNNLIVESDDSLAIDADRMLTHSGAALTLSGTISGAGTLSYQSASAFPTEGIISAQLRFDSTNNDQIVSARTYGGEVEFYNNHAASSRNITLGTGAGQTLDFSGAFYLNAANDADLALSGITNDPAVNIGGDLDYTGAGGGSESITTGSGVWTVSGNVNFTDGSFNASTDNSFQMDGNAKQLTAATQQFDDFVVAGGTISSTEDTDANGLFSITSGSYSQASGTTLYVAGDWNNSGTFASNLSTVVLNGSAPQTLSGTMTAASAFNTLTITNVSGTDPDADPAVIFSDSVTAATMNIVTSGVFVRFNAGSDYTFTNINWDGQDQDDRIAFRSSLEDNFWNLNVSGSQTVSKVDVQDSNACGGDNIDATDLSNLDSGNNDCWDFGQITFSLSSGTVELGELSVETVTADSYTVRTNLTTANGYTTLIYTDGNLRNGANDIDGVADGAVTAGSEEYGIATSDSGQEINQDTNCAAAPYASSSLSETPQSIAGALAGPVDETVTICYAVSISSDTIAGNYSQVVTFVTVGLF
ncbi:MAG: hypothetical protein COY66_03235 [Candidatus Kerfeldbacteria bacterium CG_4_10_14_0_8_um_filter_42_10]|uniref:Peptidase M14 domain-containing protein n=1 Tax=Candidatus Kerfeldbacteria bacterium CG_4_10_14_0_8_um_filter_42_10 TaxID=2014248 RepID=A0A2M7RIY7_9BACT|nr:MAG: hypothetical protein COY66_03235 [Candidatus Kerfeldbacteria bacterium CG_4_10_14_0_8_um_filter_42_10]